MITWEVSLVLLSLVGYDGDASVTLPRLVLAWGDHVCGRFVDQILRVYFLEKRLKICPTSLRSELIKSRG